jgi:hypothetical protein
MPDKKQFLVVAVVETDDPELAQGSEGMASFIERVLMLSSGGLITRCRTIVQTGNAVKSWGESGPDKVFKLIPIIEAEDKDGDGI